MAVGNFASRSTGGAGIQRRIMGNATAQAKQWGNEITDIAFRNAQQLVAARQSDNLKRPSRGRSYSNSFRPTEAVDEGGKVVAYFGNTHPAAAAIERGARPHRIAARGENMLVFPGTNDFEGRTIIVRDVAHPGTRGLHICRDAVARAIRTVNARTR